MEGDACAVCMPLCWQLWPTALAVPTVPSCLLQQSATMGALFDYLVFPLFIPLILIWLLAARLLSFVAPLLLPLSWALAARLSWACPFIPRIWELNGWFRGTLMRVGFEVSSRDALSKERIEQRSSARPLALGLILRCPTPSSQSEERKLSIYPHPTPTPHPPSPPPQWTYCMNVTRRFLTLPLRRRTADFYIVGFPKVGWLARQLPPWGVGGWRVPSWTVACVAYALRRPRLDAVADPPCRACPAPPGLCCRRAPPPWPPTSSCTQPSTASTACPGTRWAAALAGAAATGRARAWPGRRSPVGHAGPRDAAVVDCMPSTGAVLSGHACNERGGRQSWPPLHLSQLVRNRRPSAAAAPADAGEGVAPLPGRAGAPRRQQQAGLPLLLPHGPAPLVGGARAPRRQGERRDPPCMAEPCGSGVGLIRVRWQAAGCQSQHAGQPCPSAPPWPAAWAPAPAHLPRPAPPTRGSGSALTPAP